MPSPFNEINYHREISIHLSNIIPGFAYILEISIHDIRFAFLIFPTNKFQIAIICLIHDFLPNAESPISSRMLFPHFPFELSCSFAGSPVQAEPLPLAPFYSRKAPQRMLPFRASPALF
jgi:hypothetical protein